MKLGLGRAAAARENTVIIATPQQRKIEKVILRIEAPQLRGIEKDILRIEAPWQRGMEKVGEREEIRENKGRISN